MPRLCDSDREILVELDADCRDCEPVTEWEGYPDPDPDETPADVRDAWECGYREGCCGFVHNPPHDPKLNREYMKGYRWADYERQEREKRATVAADEPEYPY